VNEELRILLLEDTAEDAEVVDRELRKAGLAFRLQVVSTHATFVDALNRFAPAVVLVDSRLPDFTGRQALDLVRDLDASIPVIVVTGALGDEAAVALLHAGANDYVLKDRLARLAPAVRRTLDERAEKRMRAAAEEALHASEARFRRLFEAAADGILIVDADTGVILDANPAMLAFAAATRDAVVGRRMWGVPELRSVCGSEPAFREMVAQDRLTSKENVIRPRGRRALEVDVAGSVFQAGSARVLQCNVRDVSERRRLRRAFLDATDHEKRRLAQDIHDGLGQELAGLDLLMHGVLREVGRGELPRVHEIERISSVIRTAIQTAHDVAHGLSPLSHNPGGLVGALQALKSRLGGPPGPSLEFLVEERAAIALPSEACDHLYRIAQEAVANAIKHSGASRVEISLRVDESLIVMKITDDGRGLKRGHTRPEGLGLQTMQDRTASIGGTFQLLTDPAGGTVVACEVPQTVARALRKRRP
jgi:PAS domain S-box-containing protein